MASNWTLCGVCESLEVSTSASVWCPDCDEGLCNDCEKRHGVSKGTKTHQTLPIDKYEKLPAEILKITHTCTKHNDRYQTYCQLHDCLCCHRCVIESHNTCKDLKAVDDIVRNVKSSNALTELEESLNELTENVTKIIRHKESNIKSLKTEKQKIETKIFEVRYKVNKYLDHLQEKLMKELHILSHNENEEIIGLTQKLKERETAMLEYKKNLNKIKENASELQIFLAMKEIEKDVREEEEQLQALQCTTGAIHETHLILKINQTIQNIEQDVKLFGQIEAQSKLAGLNLETKKDKQAQLKLARTKTTTLGRIYASQARSLEISNYIQSCSFVSNEMTVFACNVRPVHNVIGIEPGGLIYFDISLKHYIHDLTFIPSTNRVAALCSIGFGKSSIIFIDIKKTKIVKSISIQGNYDGVTFIGENSILLIGNQGIRKWNISTESLEKVIDRVMPGLHRIATFKDKIYYTTTNDNRFNFGNNLIVEGKVACCDLQGNTKGAFENQRLLSNPGDITVDNEGFVFVADILSNNVVVFQPDGSQYTVLLTSADGLDIPVGIDYNRSTNQLLVANRNGLTYLYSVNKQ